MLAAAVAAGVTPSAVAASAVRVSPTETVPAAVEALLRMPSASHVEAAGTMIANTLRRVSPARESPTKGMGTARVLGFSFGACKVLAGEKRPARESPGGLSAKLAALET
jgi:hypothetical protein